MASSYPRPKTPRATAHQAGESVPITSRDNRWLKEFRLALRGGVPTPSGCYGVEGVRLVEEALGSGCRIEAVLFSESGERHRPRLAPFVNRAEMAFPVLRTTDRLFEGIADTEHPQGVAALVQPRAAELNDLLHPSSRAVSPTTNALTGVTPLLVILVGVQDPGNVGTIVRTAAAFGATGVATCASGQSGTANPFGPKALRASAGAALHLPILAGMSLPILLTQLRIGGVRTLASSVREIGEAQEKNSAAQPLLPWEVDWREPVALLVGNEGAGLPEEAERSADARVRIPMATTSESLNAAAAAAVLFYEAARQRNLLTP
ncbi:MAG: RNA methyltransferase [Acidobacteriia bacterium]|nr:RNA methyltransferase [Terriglobia bacterium]